jgi:hypothetical protein
MENRPASSAWPVLEADDATLDLLGLRSEFAPLTKLRDRVATDPPTTTLTESVVDKVSSLARRDELRAVVGKYIRIGVGFVAEGLVAYS